MVAIALGLLLLAAVAAVFVGANQSTRLAIGLAGSEEAGQIALTLIGRSVRRAGYTEIVGTGTESLARNALWDGQRIGGCTGARATLSASTATTPQARRDFFLSLTCPAPGAASAPDTLAVWYQADNVAGPAQGAMRDCLGNQVAGTGGVLVASNEAFGGAALSIPLVRNVYYVQNGRLMCEGSGSPGQPQALLENIVDFKVFYGFDDTSYNAEVAGRLEGSLYRPAASTLRTAEWINDQPLTLSQESAWQFVNSVYVCILTRTSEPGTGTAANSFLPCPQTAAEVHDGVAPATLPADGAARRRYAQFIALRSRGAAASLPQ